MLTAEDNELLCRVGPGTPMGELFRQYWLPAMLSSELPEPDCDQVRVKLLGEELIAFRDTNGDVGLLANLCPHRAASLYYARNEDCGLRCVYHGWKFDKTGACVDMPSEPPESNFKNKVRATAYPCVERHGVVWTYLGPRETPPPLPQLESNDAEGAAVRGVMIRECNWMQALEGDIDTVHFSWLHIGHIEPDEAAGQFLRYQAMNRSPKYSVVDTPWGTSYGAVIPVSEEKSYVRQAHFLFPCYTMIPQGSLLSNRFSRAWVPMDDGHVIWFSFTAPPLLDLDLNATTPEKTVAGGRRPEDLLPNSTDWYGRFRTAHTADRDYDLNRDDARAKKSFTGLTSVTMEDHAVTESMGPVLDRSNEHLGTSDAMIIRTRQRLIVAAEALRDKGTIPPGVDEPEVYRQRSGGVILQNGVNWFDATAEGRRAYVRNSEEAIRASISV
ncbi:MAG: Rieske 2Fe-2S domain-containing protein [Acidimicrobiaceae bacterium]|nr:Rieske 2Fe-2S domain-containing protein [Acidimicrobiaceae bacterium]